jgi:spore germination cell wall hydrolase CwlJ-like protein
MDHYIEILIISTIILFCGYNTSYAQSQREVVTATLILEAGGEYSFGAMEAVHEVIVNRARNRKLSPREVCLQPKQFSCWNDADVASQVIKAKRHRRWREAFAITRLPLTSYARGADHYHADYVDPYWNKSMTVVARIGRHIFYKK